VGRATFPYAITEQHLDTNANTPDADAAAPDSDTSATNVYTCSANAHPNPSTHVDTVWYSRRDRHAHLYADPAGRYAWRGPLRHAHTDQHTAFRRYPIADVDRDTYGDGHCDTHRHPANTGPNWVAHTDRDAATERHAIVDADRADTDGCYSRYLGDPYRDRYRADTDAQCDANRHPAHANNDSDAD